VFSGFKVVFLFVALKGEDSGAIEEEFVGLVKTAVLSGISW
jgi:hypothetical protein